MQLDAAEVVWSLKLARSKLIYSLALCARDGQAYEYLPLYFSYARTIETNRTTLFYKSNQSKSILR